MSDSEESAISETSDVNASRKYMSVKKGHVTFVEYDLRRSSYIETLKLETDIEQKEAKHRNSKDKSLG